VVIDPVRNYDPKSGRTAWTSAQEVAAYIDAYRLTISHVIDTHAHADHMTGLPYFRARCAARTVTGAGIGEIQRAFRSVYNLGDDFPVDGRQFDVLLDEGQTLPTGSFERAGWAKRSVPTRIKRQAMRISASAAAPI